MTAVAHDTTTSNAAKGAIRLTDHSSWVRENANCTGSGSWAETGSGLWALATRRPLKSRQKRLACKKTLRIKHCWRFLNGAPLLDCDEISTRRTPRTANVNSVGCHVGYVEIRQKCGDGTSLDVVRCTNIGHNPVDRLHCADSK